VSDQPKKPVLDEQTFQKLLEAAYVLQQYGGAGREQKEVKEVVPDRPLVRELEKTDLPVSPADPSPAAEALRPNDYTPTLAEIVDTQRQIQTRHLALEASLALIADKAAAITRARGACIGLLDGNFIHYRAAAGTSTFTVGTEVPLAAAVCNLSIVTGQVICSDDLNIEIQFDAQPCLQRGILSLLAVPIYHGGDIAGALELYFDKVHGYAEQDVHTCQLLAGMVTEALGREAEVKLKKSVAEERSSMLSAIEKLQPNLAALADYSSKAPTRNNGAEPATAPEQMCWKCGTKMTALEQFCGHCGAVLTRESETRSVQSKIASAWQMHQLSGGAAATQPQPLSPIEELQNVDGASAGVSSADPVAQPDSRPKIGEGLPVPYSDPFSPRPRPSNSNQETAAEHFPQEYELHSYPDSGNDDDQEEATGGETARRNKSEAENQVWSSAAKTREFLEKIAGTQKASRWAKLWEAHRGDFYLAVAVFLVLVAIRWGLWSNHSVAATGHGNQVSAARTKPPAPDLNLSLLDKLLISLGLAEAPEPLPYKGNPDVQVWVDPHTALYYCPGADLYGKTPKGKLTTQRSAQLDQFEPASRKPCE
jgi:hypothetical protein